MRPVLALAIVASLLPMAGCRELGPSPAISRVAPPAARNYGPTALHVFGERFAPRPWLDLDQPSRSTFSTSFTVELVSPVRTVALEDVTRVDDTQLIGTVPPLTDPGTYTVRVTDPWGRSALLDGAFTLSKECVQAQDCDDGLDCTESACEAYRCIHTLGAGQCLIADTCRGTGEVDPSNPCRLCDPTRSTDTWSPHQDGSPCNDGYACTGPVDACTAGECRGPPLCGNTPPLACLKVSPTAGPTGMTVTFDARCSVDLEDLTSALQFQFFSDGALPIGPRGSSPTTTFTYTDAGIHEASVAVWDTGGLHGHAAAYISVAGASEDVVVTISADEANPGATPANPGGLGLSLREAITYVNGTGGPKAIRFLAPMLIHADELPALTAAGARIVGMPGVVLDFSTGTAKQGACLNLAGTGQALIGVEALACHETLVQLQGSGNQVAESRLRDGRGSTPGVLVSGDDALVGPRTELFGFGEAGVQLEGSRLVVDSSRIHDNGLGLDMSGARTVTVRRSAIFGNTGSGILIFPSTKEVLLQHSTVDGNGGSGVDFSSGGASIATVQNSLFTFNGGAGLCGAAANYVERSANGFFANDGGSYCQGSPDGGVLADPLYMSPTLHDYRLQPGSPAANAGADAGFDLNGPLPGSFNGSAPDLGAHESPY